MATRVQMRRGDATTWSTANPVLADGEPGFEKTSGRLKVGDGVRAWNDLPYVGITETMLGAPNGIAMLGPDGKLRAEHMPLLVQQGEQLMTSTTEAGATVRVNFAQPYATAPAVMLDIDSKAATTTVRVASASAVTTTGFDLFFARSNTTATGVDWVAVGKPA